MFTGRMISRMFRRHNHTTRKPVRRWDRARLAVTNLESRTVPASITVTGNSDAIAVDGQVSLREAIVSMNGGVDINSDIANFGSFSGTYGTADSITFAAAYSISVGSQMSISKSMTITGLGEASTTLTNTQAAGASSRIFDISNAATTSINVSLSNMTLSKGNLTSGANLGGAIRNANESVTLTKMTFSQNTAAGQNTTTVGIAAAGGAIASTAAGGVLTIDSCTFTGNSASGTGSATSGSGGAIVLTNSTTVTINNSSFNGNVAAQIGGAIQVSGNATATPTPSSIKIDNTTFGTVTTNRATLQGGAINVAAAAAGTTLTIGNSTFTSNSAASTGGVINLATTTTLSLTSSSFSLNSAGSTGGVLHSAVANTVTIDTVTFSKNTSSSSGGAISGASSTFNVTSSTFVNNSGTGGGAIRMTGSGSNLSLTSSSFTGNTGTSTTGGGAVYSGSATATVTVSSTTFTSNTVFSSATGAAIDMAGGGLTITDSTFDSNKTNTGSGGAIANSSSTNSVVSIARTTFSKNSAGGSGGAISNTSGGSWTFIESTFSKNSANTNGGGLSLSSGTITIESTTFSGNTAGSSGGAINTSSTSNITINNSTLTGNSANGNSTTTGGGGINSSSSGSITINNSTLVYNTAAGVSGGGGVRRGVTSGAGVTSIISSIIAANQSSSGPDIFSSSTVGATNIAGGANLVGVADTGNFTLDTSAGNNVTGTLSTPKDPLIGPLGNYGGITLTHKLLPSSEALDAGKLNSQANDQTGAARPADPLVDIGAVEGFLKVPQGSSTMPGPVSIGGANTYTITVVYTDEGSIDTATLDQNDLQITGGGYSTPQIANGKPSLSGSGSSVTATYTFYAAEGNATSTWDKSDNGTYTVTLMGSQVYDSDTPTANAALTKSLGTFLVAIPQVLTVDLQSDVDDSNYGVGQLTFREAVKLSNASAGATDTINFDSSKFDGTPIVIGSTINITDSVIINGAGKAKFVLDGNNANQIINISGTGTSVTMSGATLTKGKSATGAAIQMTNQTLTLSDMDFTNGSATANGGAIALTTGNLTVTNSSFSNNSTTGDGGSIYASSTATLNISGSQFTSNTASSEGSAVYQTASGTTTTISQSLFKTNYASDSALYVGGSAKLIVSQSQFEGNTATSTSSGIVHFLASATGDFKDTTFHNNTVSGDGIIWATTSTVSFNQVTFTKNQGKLSGAIYHSSSGSVTFNNSTIVGNTATGSSSAAGGIYLLSAASKLTLNSTIVAGNVGLTTDDIYSLAGVNIAGDNSLIGLQYANWTATGTDNQIGLGTPLSAGVDALANNGGFTLPDGSTIMTMATKSGGLALGKGNNNIGNTYDQRGGDTTGPLTDYPRSYFGNTDIGAFQSPPPPIPQASAKASNVTTPGGTTFDVTVTFTDDLGVLVSSVDVNDIIVKSAIGGATINATSFVTSPPSGTGNPVTATFTFNAPGGVWDASDSDVYSVWINGTVSDASSNNVTSPQQLTSFTGELGGRSLVVSLAGDTDDGNYTSGQLTLREAVNFSNINSGVDTVTFSLASGTTITLGSVLVLADSVEITGPANPSNLTVSGNDSVQIFNVSGTGTTATLSGMTLAQGKATNGGAIQLTTQTLNLTDMVLKNNSSTSSGGAIYASSTATVNVNSTHLIGNTGTLGGAIYLGNGVLTVDKSLFNSNRGSSGGTIYLSSSGATLNITSSQFQGNSATGSGIVYLSTSSQTLNVTDTTFADNSVTTSGGAIYIGSTDVVTIKQSTFSKNHASTGGAIYAASTATLNLHNSTIAGNSATSTSSAGGIHVTGTAAALTMYSTIVADNTGPTTNDIYASTGYNFGGDFNLIGLQHANWTLSGSSNQIGASSALSPGLDALADNGGVTLPDGSKILTMATQANGAAWYTGSNTSQSFANDQRGAGFNREYAGFTDVGAYQHQIVSNPEAIAKANNVVSPGGTTFDVTVTFVDNVNVNGATVDINDVVVKSAFGGLTLNATGVAVSTGGLGNPVTATYTFNAPDNAVLGTWDASDTGVYNVWIVGTVSDNAGNNVAAPQKLSSFSALLGSKSLIVSNSGDTDDGDYSTGQLTLREAVNFSNTNINNVDTISFSLPSNTTIFLGGTLGLIDAVDISGSGKTNLSISGQSTFQIFNISGVSTSVTMSGVTLTQGRATTGGAIQFTTQSVTLNNVDITDSSATSTGGAIALTTGTLDITNGKLVNNIATSSGGGIYGSSTVAITLTDSQLMGNTGTTGGGLFFGSGTATLKTSIFNGNRGTNGGGVYASTTNVTLDIQNSYFTGNVATSTGGGGVYMNVGGTLTISNSTFEGNTASSTGSTSGGGAISVFSNTSTITNSTFSKNVAQVGGAIRSASAGTINLYNSTIVGNTGIGGAGGIQFTGTSSTTLTAHNFQSTIIAGNTGVNGPDILVGSTASTLGFAINGDNNLVGEGHVYVQPVTGAGNQIGSRTPIDPGVNPLANNGGFSLPDGSTIRTMSLKSTSPAIDKGNTAGSPGAFDQRGTGFARTKWLATDVGAFEYASVTPIAAALANTVTTGGGTTFDVTVTFTDDFNIDANTVDINDVVVKSYAGAVTYNATSVVVSPPSGTGNPVTATYTFNAPGGAWDALDQDLYEVFLTGTVSDADTPTQNVVTGKIGAFGAAFAPVSLVVDEASDVDDGNYSAGKLSLREALMLANGNVGQNDSITFNLPSGTTITLTSHQIISDPVSISGPGANKLTIDANHAGRHFTLSVGGMAVSISGMKLINGFAPYGGAIQWTGSDSVTVDGVWFDSNAAPYGFLTWSGGGAIGGYSPSTSSGNITVKNSTFSNNSAFLYGGAISLLAGNTYTISNSTFSGNTAARGGAIGGPMSSVGILTIKNSTITGNTGGSGTLDTGGGIFLADSTASIGRMSIESSIIAGNVATNAPDIRGYSPTDVPWFTIKNSIIGKHTHGLYTDVGGASFVGTIASPVDPLLNTLANYGGPMPTHSLMAGSLAINAGTNPDTLSFDQRGTPYTRANGVTDIGAYEVQPPATVSSVVISDGSGLAVTHRSQFRQIIVTFSAPVTFAGSAASAFALSRTGSSLVNGNPLGNVMLLASPSSGTTSSVTITFNPADTTFVENGSLIDGLYDFKIDATQVSTPDGALDGDGVGGFGGDHVITGTIGNKWFRLFGDHDGNGTVNQVDFNAFRLAFLGGPSLEFDFDNDSQVSQPDFNAFRLRFLGAP